MDRTVVVTGTSRGLGKMLAEHFLDDVDTVIGISRSGSDELAADWDRYYDIKADVGDPVMVRRAFAAIAEMKKNVDLLVNNAGVGPSGFTITASPDDFENAVRTNLLGVVYCSREYARLQGHKGGRIVNIGSVLTALEPVGASAYVASKAGAEAAAGVMAKELARFGITVNTVGMASIGTEMFAALGTQGQKYVDALPIPRLATIEDVTRCIEFFMDSPFVTGQCVFLGGVR